MKISILAQEETGELGAEVIKGLQEIRDQKLKEREEGATKIISNKREYIRHIFNRAINRIINQRLATVQVKIADLGNACFDVSKVFYCLNIFTFTYSLISVPPLHGGHSDAPIQIR